MRFLREVALVATLMAFISHLPSSCAGDSCQVKGGTLKCDGPCAETFAEAAPIQDAFKLSLEAKACQPSWPDVKRVLPGLLVRN